MNKAEAKQALMQANQVAALQAENTAADRAENQAENQAEIQAENHAVNQAVNHPDAARHDSSDNSLDALADALLLRIARAFGECVAQPEFCGFAVDETRDDAGRLLALALIPCDRDQADAPQRRLARGALALAKAH